MIEDELVESQYVTPVAEFSLYMPENAPQTDRHAHPAYEPVATRKFGNHLTDLLDNDPVFYDIGSRYGPYTLIAISLGISPKSVYTFEQNERAYGCLNYTLNQRGILDEVHSNNRTVGRSDDNLRLDDYVNAGNDSPDILKMDIEGAEYDALWGFSDTIQGERPYMLIELHPWRLIDNFNSHPDEVIELLQEWDYDIKVAPTQRREATSWTDIENYSINPDHNDNALMCIPEQ